MALCALLFHCTWVPMLRAAEPLEVDPVVLAAEQQRVEVMRQAATATISIFGLDGGGGGSGVIISDDGYALTNYHVSSACGNHMRCGLSDGRMLDAVIVGIDATGDVSLIKLFAEQPLPVAPMGDSDQVRVGQWAIAAGNPFVLATNLQPSMSLGMISGTHRYQYPAGTILEYADCIQTDAAINPGNSGGPLFNLAGEVIGINGRCSFEKRGRINVGVGYAISINQIKMFLSALKSGRLVDHATLGATVATDGTGRVVVSNLLSSSDAYRRGLRYGDEILALADREISTTNEFKNVLGTLPRGWRVPLQIRRDGELITLLVRLDGVHTEQELIKLVTPEKPTGHDPAPPEGDREKGESTEQETADGEQGELSPLTRWREVPELAALAPDTEIVAAHFESRPGFANYYFNQLHRQRLSEELRQRAGLGAFGPQWRITGRLATEPTQTTIELTPERGRLSIGSRRLEVGLAGNRSDVVAERRESGLLLALQGLLEFLRQGPEQMGDTVYLGAMPVYAPGQTALSEASMHDVLRVLWGDVELRLFVQPDSDRISLVEVHGDAGDDPVELYVDQHRPLAGDQSAASLPHRLRLQYGGDVVMIVDVESYTNATTTTDTED